MWNVDDSSSSAAGGSRILTTAAPVVKPDDPRAGVYYDCPPYTEDRFGRKQPQHQRRGRSSSAGITTMVDASAADFTMHRARVQRKWEVLPGKNQYFCGGRIVMARQAGIFYLTLFLIVATSLLFFVFDCPYLADKVSVFIPVVSGILFIFTLSNLFKTSFTDPGKETY